MDRVDVAQQPKRVRVTDYKGGKYTWQDEDEFRGGRNVQLAIYILAALTSITVVQRIAYVRTQLNAKSEG